MRERPFVADLVKDVTVPRMFRVRDYSHCETIRRPGRMDPKRGRTGGSTGLQRR